jgi:XTP/dITP diphosphohydrolase
MTKLVLATENKDKAREIKELLADIAMPVGIFEILDLNSFPGCPEVNEDGKTLQENALKKAREIFRHAKVLTLADDTGLEVYYLLGAPGVFSSRYAGEDVTYEDNRRKLLRELKGVPPRKRYSRFRCVMALVGNGIEETVEGVVEGKILFEGRGANGFGYDPLFVPEGYHKTLAEMSSEEKNKISHRARAVEKIRSLLKEVL